MLTGSATCDEGLLRLRVLLCRAARFEAGRRRDDLLHLSDNAIDEIACAAADAALADVLTRLGEFRRDGRFATWASKFAVLETAVCFRKLAWKERETTPVPMPPLLLPILGTAIAESLTPRQRNVFEAVVFAGVPIDVLAARIATTRSAVYDTLHEARSALRQSLADS